MRVRIGLMGRILVVFAVVWMPHNRTFGQTMKGNMLSCSPAPCVLPPTQASEGGFEVNTTPIVADPLNPVHLLLGSVDANCPFGGPAAFTSGDGGTSWIRAACMAGLGKYYPGIFPSVGYDRNGIAYIAGQYYDNHDGGTMFVGIESSSDGVNWSVPIPALGKLGSYIDTPWLVVDTNATSPYANRIYVSANVVDQTNQVVVAHSSDRGATWHNASPEPPQSGRTQDLFNTMSIGKNGTVYLSWLHCPGAGPNAGCQKGLEHMVFSKSTDGGNTWTFPTLMRVTTVSETGILPNTNGVRVYNYPAIGVDNSNGPYAGTLYVVMYEWTGSYFRIGVIRSSDDGKTWSKPVPVAPRSNTHDQFFPWLSVSPTGLVGVSWLDRRNDPANVKYQAFAAISRDGGQSFQPNIQLTTAFSDPNNNGDPGDWLGDYTGNTWAGPNNFVAAWMDTSNGINTQEYVGGIRLK